VNILSDTNRPNKNRFATIGFFDGVHLGHRFLLNRLNEYAAQFGLESLVVSFADSPQRILSPNSDIKLLTTSSEKLEIFSELGLQNCLMLNFDHQLALKTSAEFLRDLRDRFCVRRLLMGYDHHFGSDKLSTFADYVVLGQTMGVEVDACSPFVSGEVTVSSSKIRDYLQQGDIENANRLLGADYTLTGFVASGSQIGRQINFPTANLTLPAEKLVPRNGVYAVEVDVCGKAYKGMLNIGVRPTVAGNHQTVEVHILDFEGNIYGTPVTLRLKKRLRDERKFESLDELSRQLQHDRETIMSLYKSRF